MSLKLNEDEKKEVEKKENREKNDPVEISYKYLKKVKIYYIIIIQYLGKRNNVK